MSARLDALRARPWHLLLGALVAGLLAGPLGARAVVLAAAGLAALAARPPLAVGAAVLVAAGGALAVARLHSLDRTALRPLLGSEVTRQVVLLDAPRAARFGSTALARLRGGRGGGERVLLRMRSGTAPGGALDAGTVLRVEGRLRALAPYESYQRRYGAHATLVARGRARTGGRRGGIGGAVDTVRRRSERALDAGLDPPRAALMRGMVLGQDQALGASVRRDFQRSGLSHLVAASGENVALLVALVVPLLAWAGFGRTGRLVGALAIVALYVPLAGNGPSIQRAGVMGAAMIVAALAGRPSSRWYALGLAAALTLAWNPRSAGDPGWQLSFAAVAAILLLAPRWRVALLARRVPAPLADAASLTAAATLSTAPIIAYDFGQLSLASLPANVAAAPLVAPITWLGALAAAAGQLWLLPARVLDALAAAPLGLLLAVAHLGSAAPAAVLPVRIPSAAALIGAYAVLLALALAPWRRLRRALWRGGAQPRRRAAWASLAAAAVLTTALLRPSALGAVLARPAALARSLSGAPAGGSGPPGGLRVSFLDVGQGDATLLQDGPHAVLVDTGPPGGPILTRLREEGVRALDLLVTTHPQSDHDGGAAAVLARYRVATLLDGDDGRPTPDHRAILAQVQARHVRAIAPDAGEVLRAGPIELDVLWPHREPAALHAGEDPNQRAIVAEARDGPFSLLLTADAESDVTAPLSLGPVTALKVAHHGSADPGLPDLLRQLQPQVAVIEVGAHNPYGHPAPQALRALATVPRVYRTDRDGTVRLIVDRGRMTVSTNH